MSKGDRLRALVSERLTAAAEDIFALVEKTIAEYEEELCRSKEENQRKQEILDSVFPQQQQQQPVQLHGFQITSQTPEFTASTQIPETKPIKQEPEEPRSVKQEEEPLPTSSNANNILISQVSSLWATNDVFTGDRSPASLGTSSLLETEAEGGHYDQRCPFCTKSFRDKESLESHIRVHTQLFVCSVCKREFEQKNLLDLHMKTHSGRPHYSGSASTSDSFSASGSTVFNVWYREKKTRMNLMEYASYSSFLTEARQRFGLHSDASVYLTDETNTEVDADVFCDIIKEQPNITLIIVDSLSVTESAARFACSNTFSVPSHSCEPEICYTIPKRRRTEERSSQPKQIRRRRISRAIPSTRKRIVVNKPAPEIKFAPGNHWPLLTEIKNANRCKESTCRRKTKYICMQCHVALCPGCFSNFHTR